MKVDLPTLKRLLQSDPMGRLIINNDVCVAHVELDAEALAHVAPLRAKAVAEKEKAATRERERKEDAELARICGGYKWRDPQPQPTSTSRGRRTWI